MIDRPRTGPIAVVDFARAGSGISRLEFSEPCEIIVVDQVAEVRGALARVEAHARDGRYAVGFVSYDAAPAFDSAIRTPGAAPTPLVWFGIFDAPAVVGAQAVDAPRMYGAEWRPHVTRGAYDDAIEAVRRGILAGAFYQVNHTVRLRSTFDVSHREVYEGLRAAQPRSYGMLLDAGRFTVMSISPELFFERKGRQITTRPMKGTAPRRPFAADDLNAGRLLAASEKDRAENVMIVDLVRNDLGRIAESGSVQVRRLFEVERHPTVWQMTSTIVATARQEVSLPDIFAALFPSGSVVGAPKIAAASFIADHEGAPRGVYCGAMGIVLPGGDCTFNVAIRTLVVDRARGVAEYGVGGGITIDSTASGEYDEILAKAAVLRGTEPAFELLETMRLSNGTFVRRARHVRRLSASAEYFDFTFAERSADSALDRCAEQHPTGDHRVRLLVARDGSVRCEVTAIATPGETPATMTYGLAASPVWSRDPFLFHKTTRRDTYEQRRRERPDVDEVILVNERGELTECSIGNLVIEIDGVRLTPPIDSGLLPGVYREELIEAGVIRERVLFPSDLETCSGTWLINSLRQWVRIQPRVAPASVVTQA